MKSPLEKIALLENSLRCYVYGWIGLIPILGIPTAILALLAHRRSRLQDLQDWNAAHNYRKCGRIFAIAGLFISLIVITVLTIAIISKMDDSSYSE